MTLAERIQQTLTRAGCRMSASVARSVIAQVREHDADLAKQIRRRELPLPDCPDGCVIGAEWRRQALEARRITEEDAHNALRREARRGHA